MYYTILLLCFIPSIYSLNFVIPLPNTLVVAGTSSLVTWGGLGDNITATSLYLGNGASANQLTIISIFGQGMSSSKTSMWITMPKDAPNDNTYLILEGNDNPPTRATVPLNIALGSKDTPSAVPTATSSSTPSASSSSSMSSRPSSSSNASSSSSTEATKKPSASESSPSTTASQTPTQSHSSNDNDSALTAGQTAGIVIGSIGAMGLALGALFLIRRNRRLNNHKRHTELFDEKDHGTLEYNHPPYGALPPPSQPFPTMAGHDDKYQISYSRNPGPTQAPSAYYAMKTLDSTSMRDNGFQSRTQISPSIVNKPDEASLADRPDKPHSRS